MDIILSKLFNIILIFFIIQNTIADRSEKSKRQIFREQVLPHSGGKIPESAFRTDRLALNKLQKLGVAVPDGVSLEARYNSVLRVNHDPEHEYTVVRVIHEDEGRYTPHEGRSFPQYPKSVQTTYLIRPPIGSYRYGPHIYRAIPGPPLKLGGASIEATTGNHGNHGTAHTQYGNNLRPYSRYPQSHYEFNNLHNRVDPALASPDIPAPTINPDHAHYLNQGGIDATFEPTPTSHFIPSNPYNNLYSEFIRNYGGLLRVTAPLRYSSPYNFLSYSNIDFPASNGAYSIIEPSEEDLGYRLRRRIGAEEVSPAASETNTKTVENGFDCTGREQGNVYSDPLTGCKKQFMCLEDGRAAAYICPEGTSFDHRARKCNIRKRRTKLDENCNLM